MSSTDWDAIPQPVRAMAFIQMARYWSTHYTIGREYGRQPAVMAETVGAIIMTESWFEHHGLLGSEPLGDRARPVRFDLRD